MFCLSFVAGATRTWHDFAGLVDVVLWFVAVVVVVVMVRAPLHTRRKRTRMHSYAQSM